MKLLRASFLLIVFGLSTPCLSDDTVVWSESGNWKVMVDTSINNGCFIIGSYTRGTVLRVGVDNVRKRGYLMFANDAWRSLEVGKQYKLGLEFDGEPQWTGTFTAARMGSAIALANSFDTGSFLQDMATKQSLTVYFEQTFVTKLPLTGTYAAVQSLVQCQE